MTFHILAVSGSLRDGSCHGPNGAVHDPTIDEALVARLQALRAPAP